MSNPHGEDQAWIDYAERDPYDYDPMDYMYDVDDDFEPEDDDEIPFVEIYSAVNPERVQA